MKFSDIITLAKAGYKYSEVKDLLDYEVKSEAEPAEPEKEPEPEREPEPEKELEPQEDYKAKYEALLEENRKASLSRDISGKAEPEPSAEDLVNKALAEILS